MIRKEDIQEFARDVDSQWRSLANLHERENNDYSRFYDTISKICTIAATDPDAAAEAFSDAIGRTGRDGRLMLLAILGVGCTEIMLIRSRRAAREEGRNE